MRSPPTSPLLTDLYELTMLQTYFERGMTDTAVFEFFARKLPAHRGFLLAAGLEQALDFLTDLRFTESDLEWVRRSDKFSKDFADELVKLRFEGDVHAMPEGTAFFDSEPILRVTAPMPQAQLVETRLINILHFQTLIASKAARVVLAAPGKLLVDFGLRRAHGAEAGLMAARAGYIAGFAGTSNVLAAAQFDIPAFGTMAHSFIQAHDSESEAFESFARSHPKNVTLLIDTYDTEAGARKVAALAPRLKEAGIALNAVRIDSGDLAAHAFAVREILNAAGLRDYTFSRAAVSTNTRSAISSHAARRSTATASAPISIRHRTRPTSTASTRFKNTRAAPGANARPARPRGRDASKCFAATMPTQRCAATCLRWKATNKTASR